MITSTHPDYSISSRTHIIIIISTNPHNHQISTSSYHHIMTPSHHHIIALPGQSIITLSHYQSIISSHYRIITSLYHHVITSSHYHIIKCKEEKSNRHWEDLTPQQITRLVRDGFFGGAVGRRWNLENRSLPIWQCVCATGGK